MHVCMYVCMYACTYGCMYVCMNVCACVCTYVCMYVCMYVCTYVCMHVCMHVRMYVCAYVHMPVHMPVQWNLIITNPRGHKILLIISEIHYNQLIFHSRTQTGSHVFVHYMQKFPVRVFLIRRFHCTVLSIVIFNDLLRTKE